MTWKTLTERDRREWNLNEVDSCDRYVWRSSVRSAMRAASQLPAKEPTDVDDAPTSVHLNAECDPLVWTRGLCCSQNKLPEHDHVANQIIKYTKYMLANTLPLYTPSTPGRGQNDIFYLKVVMLHSELTGMSHKIPCKQIFSPFTHPRSRGWGQKVKTFF